MLEWPLAHERGEVEIQHLCEQINCLKMNEDSKFLSVLGRYVDQARVQSALAIDAHQVDAGMVGSWLADVADHATRACLRSTLHLLNLPADVFETKAEKRSLRL